LGVYPPVPEVFDISSFIRSSTVEYGRDEGQMQLPRRVMMKTECLSIGQADRVKKNQSAGRGFQMRKD
jgi:hypothetical protein